MITHDTQPTIKNLVDEMFAQLVDYYKTAPELEEKVFLARLSPLQRYEYYTRANGLMHIDQTN